MSDSGSTETREKINEEVSTSKKVKLASSEADSSSLNKSDALSKPSISNAKNYMKNNTLLVSTKQKGNPLLKFITGVPWEYSEIVPDYVLGKHACALFLSVRYHLLNPDYIHDRLKRLGNAYNLRVLLVQVDIADPNHALKHLTRMCILADLTLMLAWNAEEAGKIIETYKQFENKPPDMIMGTNESVPYQKLINALTTVRSVNKTDATTLLSTFGTLENILQATPQALSLCTGFGMSKAERLYKVLHEPFLRSEKSEDVN